MALHRCTELFLKGSSAMKTNETIVTHDRYAIFETGGKQYQAIPGKTLAIEKINGEAGAQVEFDTILVKKNDSDSFEFGRPYVKNAVIKASIVKQTKGPKVIVFKHKRRKAYSVKKGHRQLATVIRIETIS